ncbi:uncharacterized protein K452DRAFT_195140, partial [Aplosporella prunicola CBS 121167]
EDNPEALALLLNIAHLRFTEVPTKIDFKLLVHLAILTDKYGATKCIRPWIKKWMDDLEHLIHFSGHEEWLWIAWEYGNLEQFERILTRLFRDVEVDSH